MFMSKRFGGYARLCIIAVSLTLGACSKPTYPKCESDENCLQKGEVCVNGQCQECRDADQCAIKYPGEKRECNAGRCELKPECTADNDCTAIGAGLVCRSNKCVPECAQDTDCGAGHKCISRRCTAECKDDVECGPNRSCVKGECQEGGAFSNLPVNCRPINPGSGDLVNLEMVHFEFNKYDLSPQTKEELDRIYSCLKLAPAHLKVVVEGHCDDRGTQEYNLALGEKRAHAVQAYLKTLGADAKRFSVRSKGENEPLCSTADDACFGQNRRVQFIQQH